MQLGQEQSVFNPHLLTSHAVPPPPKKKKENEKKTKNDLGFSNTAARLYLNPYARNGFSSGRLQCTEFLIITYGSCSDLGRESNEGIRKNARNASSRLQQH